MSNFSATFVHVHLYIMATTWWDYDDDVRFASNQHAELDFYSASSLKQQFAGRPVTPNRHIVLIPRQPGRPVTPNWHTFCIVLILSQPVFVLTP
jgi:hypothetical protein